jgi:hypothetical protein
LYCAHGKATCATSDTPNGHGISCSIFESIGATRLLNIEYLCARDSVVSSRLSSTYYNYHANQHAEVEGSLTRKPTPSVMRRKLSFVYRCVPTRRLQVPQDQSKAGASTIAMEVRARSTMLRNAPLSSPMCSSVFAVTAQS